MNINSNLFFRALKLLEPGGHLDLSCAPKRAGPVEEGDAGVAQVGVLEGVHLVASLGDGPSRRAAAAEVEALEEDREIVLRMVHLSSLVVLVWIQFWIIIWHIIDNSAVNQVKFDEIQHR